MPRHFPFVQLEFTTSLGPPAGRYLLQPVGAGPAASIMQGEDPAIGSADVMVVRVVGAAPAKRGILKKATTEAKDGVAAREVSLTVVTVVRGTQLLADARTGDQLLATLKEPEAHTPWIDDAIADLNRAIVAYRASSADPFVMEVSRADPRGVRIGHGIGEEVFAGRWSKALEVFPPAQAKVPRQIRLMPAQATAHLLAGHGRVLESEELILRAQLDLRQGRRRAAAVGLHAGFDLLLGEFSGDVLPGSVRQRLEAVMESRSEFAALARQAQTRELDDEQAARMTVLADQVGGVIDRWRYEPLGF